MTADQHVDSVIEGTARPASSRPRRWPLELLGTTIVTMVMVTIWIMPRGFQGGLRILGHHDSDIVKHYWNLWWFRQMVLVDHKLPYATDYLNYPDGFLLYPIEPLNGLAALLLGGVFGLPWTTNLLALLNLTVAGLGMYALVRFLTERYWPALLAGLFYALSSYAVWTIYVGVGELSHMGWMPLAILMLLRTARDGGKRNIALTTLLFFVTAFACWYYALFLYLIAGLFILTCPWRRGGGLRLWGRYLIILGVSMAFLLPIQKKFDVSYRRSPHSQEGLVEFVQRRMDSQPHDAPPTRLDLVHMLRGGKEIRHKTIQNPYNAGRFLGFSATLLALVALIARPGMALRWLLVLVTMTGLGFGSRIVLGGEETGPLLPFHYFNLGLEWFSQPMNFPARFVMPTTMALAVLVGLGLAGVDAGLRRLLDPRIGKWGAVAAAMIVIALGAIPILEHRARGDVSLPLPSLAVEPLPAAGFLEKDPDAYAVLEFPQMYEDGRKARDSILLMQTVHGKKSSSLPLDRISTFVMSSRQFLRTNLLIQSLMDMDGLAGPDERACCLGLPPNDEYLLVLRRWLLDRSFRRLVITYRDMDQKAANQIRAFCRHVFGDPIFESEFQEIFAIKHRVSK